MCVKYERREYNVNTMITTEDVCFSQDMQGQAAVKKFMENCIQENRKENICQVLVTERIYPCLYHNNLSDERVEVCSLCPQMTDGNDLQEGLETLGVAAVEEGIG